MRGNPELVVVRRRIKLFNWMFMQHLTLEQYLELKEQQKNSCAICHKPFLRTPHIDHDHKTGVIRGLLCFKCNVGLGNFEDNIEKLEEAAKYLARYKYANLKS